MHTLTIRMAIRRKWLLYTVGALAILLDSSRLMGWVDERCTYVEVVYA